MRQGSADIEFRAARATASVNLDGSGKASLSSGFAFLDHMLQAFCKTGQLDLEAQSTGGQYYRAIALGRALGLAISNALGDHRGIRRYGSATVPMDESLAKVALDFSGRAFLVLHGELASRKIGDLEIQEIKSFMEAFADGANLTLHIKFYGENDHHKAESIFKALGMAVREAVTGGGAGVPSTKGVI